MWHREGLKIFALKEDGDYEELTASRLLPKLDTSLVERCVRIRSWQKARKEFRAGMASRR